MDRLFLDANVLFSAAYRTDAGLVQFWKLKDVILCSSHYAVEEARINLSENAQRRRLAKLAQRLRLFEATRQDFRSGLSLPEKDAPILLAAIEAQGTAPDHGRCPALRVVFREANRGDSDPLALGLPEDAAHPLARHGLPGHRIKSPMSSALAEPRRPHARSVRAQTSRPQKNERGVPLRVGTPRLPCPPPQF